MGGKLFWHQPISIHRTANILLGLAEGHTCWIDSKDSDRVMVETIGVGRQHDVMAILTQVHEDQISMGDAIAKLTALGYDPFQPVRVRHQWCKYSEPLIPGRERT